VALGILGRFLLRRKTRWNRFESPLDEEDSLEPEQIVVPEPTSPAVPVAPVLAAERPDLLIAFRPTRAGLNMLSATVEGELTVTNQGAGDASDIRVRAVLLTAHPGLDTELAALRTEPVGRPATPTFSLAPHETRALRVVAAAARETLQVLTAGERPMFVPVIAIDVVYETGQVGQAYAVGVERVDSAKLAPFWLDMPPKSFVQVAAREHGPKFGR
jgi:hypothetical protein